jgi:DNA-binding GntR family transcriptional regulator
MKAPVVAPLIHEGLGERVYKTIRDLILGQLFAPGSKLNVERLGRELGVSRTPVWEAMRRLESEGLVETVPRQGVFVLNFSMDRVVDLFAVRGALEGLGARLAASRMDPADRTALEQGLEELEAAFRGQDLERYSRNAIELHDRLLAAARNQVLSRQLENVYAQIHVLRLRSLSLPDRLAASLDEHSRIVRAVLAGSADEAEAIARQHAARVLEDALSAVTQGQSGS